MVNRIDRITESRLQKKKSPLFVCRGVISLRWFTFDAADLVVGEVHVGERDGRRGDDLEPVVVKPHVADAREAGEDATPNALQFVVGKVQVEEGGQLPECGRFQGLEVVVVKELDAKIIIDGIVLMGPQSFSLLTVARGTRLLGYVNM